MSRMLRVLPQAPARPPLAARLEALRAELVALDEGEARARFELPLTGALLKTGVSLCPTCLEHVPAAFFRDGRRVLVHKRCERHGLHRAVVENHAPYFMLSNRDRWGRRYAPAAEHRIPDWRAVPGASCCDDTAGCCGPAEVTDQSATRTCTVLVEVTDACNLACPVCYSDAKGDRMLPLERFVAHVSAMLDRKGGADSVQLTGGEATMHPDFWAMVQWLYDEPRVKRVYLPTNGVAFTRDDNVRRLEALRDKVMVLLQFDGLSRDTDERLRDATLGRVRERVVGALDEAGVAMQLTMTLARGVNLHEVGPVIDLAMARENVRLVALQPATTSGRYELPSDPMARLTLGDVAEAVTAHARLRMRPGDFAPIPCSHPGCGWISLFYRRFGLHENVVKYIDLGRVMDTVAARTVLDQRELRETVGSTREGLRAWVGRAVGRVVRPRDIFSVAIKPFMDRHDYDQDRVSSCCHHTMDTQGNLASFCEYNALLRRGDDWSRLPVMPRAT